MATNFSSWCWHLKLASLLAIGGAIATPVDCAIAQLVPDTSLGAESSVVTPNVDINGISGDRIDGGAIRGTNLFHSFEQFSIPTGTAAYFNNALEIQNIISRVTGSSISNIDGLIRTNGTASLFLLNPNGIIFGSNASLDIRGSFLGSTASSLNLADGTQFSATAPQTTPPLTVSVPLGLQFGSTVGEIRVQGSGAMRDPYTGVFLNREAGLSVQPEATLALVSNNVALEGGILTTDGGRIELGSVAGNGLVRLTPIDKGWALSYEDIFSFGDIHLSGTAAVDANGAGGGDIQIWGRRVTLTNGSQIEASTLGAEPGGTLRVRASESVEAIGITADGSSASGILAQVYPEATGAGGNLNIETGRLLMLNGAQIGTGTFGPGAAGNLTLSATELVELSGSSEVELSGSSEKAQVSSRLATDVGEGATGAGGNLNLETRRLIVQDGGQISSFIFGAGSGGTLTVRGSDSVELSGTSPVIENRRYPSGILTSVQEKASGNAGDLNLETRRLIIQDGAALSTATFGEGSGGTLEVRAYDSVELIGESLDGHPSTISAQAFESSIGDVGNLIIEARELIVRDGAEVGVSSLNPTNTKGAGDLRVQAQTIRLDNQGKLIAETASGQGGNITLQDVDLLQLRRNSQISATAGTAQAGGNGGNINIDTDLLAALENSDITANAFKGRGGKVEINTEGDFRSLDSEITASSQLGPQFEGVVEINTPEVDLQSSLTQLATNFVSPDQVVAGSCLARRNVERGSFTITGTGGLPNSPYDAMSGRYTVTTVQPIQESNTISSRAAVVETVPWKRGDPIQEAQGMTVTADGRTIVGTAPQLVALAKAQNLVCHSN